MDNRTQILLELVCRAMIQLQDSAIRRKIEVDKNYTREEFLHFADKQMSMDDGKDVEQRNEDLFNDIQQTLHNMFDKEEVLEIMKEVHGKIKYD